MSDNATDDKESGSNGLEAQKNEEDDNSEKPKKQAVLAPLPMEWTQMACPDATKDLAPVDTVRYPWDVMDLPNADTGMDFLEIVGTAGQKVTRMGNVSQRYPNLESLVLRSHLIRTMDGLANFNKLKVLELYDNIIDELRCLNNEDTRSNSQGGAGIPGKLLRVLDISYNVIRDMAPVEFCPNLQELCKLCIAFAKNNSVLCIMITCLFRVIISLSLLPVQPTTYHIVLCELLDIAQNKIKTIKGLRHLKHLRKIDLGANRIRVMEEAELEGLVNLEELWLGKNKIEKIEGLSKVSTSVVFLF